MNFSIETDRLHLATPTIEDVDSLFELMSDERLTTFLTWESHKSKETTKSLVDGLINSQKEGRGYHWCVFYESEIIGLVSLIDVRRTIRTWTIDRSELSYWIAPSMQGNGFATEAARAVVEFGFNELAFHKIIIAHANLNVESKRICEKLEFKQYAYEQDAFCKEGRWHDLIWYERIKK